MTLPLRAVLPLVAALAALTACSDPADDPATPPVVAAVEPSSGPMRGGTPVVVTGTGFHDGATVSFGAVGATDVAFVSDTQVRATTPEHATGWAAVTVRNADGLEGALADAYFFNPPVLVVSPSSGPATGGWFVSVVAFGGYEFGQPVQIWFGDVPASVRASPVPTATSFVANVPAGAAGSVAVRVVNADGSAYPATATYTYE